jgi:hypothetical protein
VAGSGARPDPYDGDMGEGVSEDTEAGDGGGLIPDFFRRIRKADLSHGLIQWRQPCAKGLIPWDYPPFQSFRGWTRLPNQIT